MQSANNGYLRKLFLILNDGLKNLFWQQQQKTKKPRQFAIKQLMNLFWIWWWKWVKSVFVCNHHKFYITASGSVKYSGQQEWRQTFRLARTVSNIQVSKSSVKYSQQQEQYQTFRLARAESNIQVSKNSIKHWGQQEQCQTFATACVRYRCSGQQ